MLNEKRVLFILAYAPEKLDLVKSKLPQDNFIVHTRNEKNKEEAWK